MATGLICLIPDDMDDGRPCGRYVMSTHEGIRCPAHGLLELDQGPEPAAVAT